MRIAYLLDRPELCGGVKVVFQHANLCQENGFDVTIIAVGSKPEWVQFAGRYIDLKQSTSSIEQQAFDLVITTFWTTVAMAEQLNIGPIVHYCQGYEASYPHLKSQWHDIRSAYDKPYPSFAVSDFLVNMLSEKHNKQTMLVPPCLDDRFRPMPYKTVSTSVKRSVKTPVKILLSGIYECNWKGVETGLKAVILLRESCVDCELTRLSLTPISAQERALLLADHYYCAISPPQVADITREADIVLFPSLLEEGFGLPLLEAMASGAAVIASAIPSVQQITAGKIPLCTPKSAKQFAEQAELLINDSKQWQQRIELGLSLAEAYQPQAVLEQLQQAIEWAVDYYG